MNTNVNLSDSKRTRWLIRGVSATLAVVLLLGGVGLGGEPAAARKRASPRLVQAFDNAASIAIPDGSQAFASTIAVSGFETEVADIDVTIRNFTHGRSNDVDMLLIGPGGQTAVFFSDLGSSANGMTIVLDDQAPAQVPTGSLSGGTFQPTNFQANDVWSPPAPANTASGSQLSVFNNTNPNGAWTLVIRDDDFGTTGALNGGWSLNITSANGVPDAQSESYTTKAGQTLNEPGSVLQNDRDPDNDALTAILAGEPGKGQVQLQPDGSFTYKSSRNAKGTDSFTYLAQDPSGLSDLETVTIQIKKAKKKRKK